MPDINRNIARFDCNGIDLVHPIDRMPQGSYPYLFNVRVLEEGRIDGRPGYTDIIDLPAAPNSIRRLNDPARLFSTNGYIYVGGVGNDLFAGPVGGYHSVDTGYSGKPLSLIPFKPDQATGTLMYVFDENKNSKAGSDGVVQPVGVAPPSKDPDIEYGIPATVDINNGQSVTGWVATGVSSTPVLVDRTNSSAPTIASILYNTGSTGWACLSPVITQPFWMGDRMKVILSAGTEEVVVREIHKAIANTTLAAIQYDSGNTGLCSLILFGNPPGVERNSLITISGEVVRVLAVIQSISGDGYSIRCSTNGSYVGGNVDVVTGLLSWFVYTVNPHTAGESITSSFVSVSHSGAGVGSLELSTGVDASRANGRTIDIANDYLHISVFLQNPGAVTDLKLLLSLDSTPNFSFDNPGNSLIWTIPGAQLKAGGSGDSWSDLLVLPLSEGVRSGSDLTRDLSNIHGIAIQMTSTAACSYGFDWWYLFGTYGPTIQPNSPVGIVYQSRFRDSRTGAHSVPGPQNRFQLFPLREAVIVTPETTTQAGIDEIDIYRQGGAVTSSLYVGSVPNNPVTPQSFTDTLPDSAVLAINQPPDLTALQPWPILGAPRSGIVNVTGTSVFWVSGDLFDLDLVSNSIITINGIAYLTFGQPRTPMFLEITQSAGYQINVPYSIASPTLAGQSLPFAFGPLEGPFAPVIFALGDLVNGGNLYFSNFSDLDSASDQNFLELSTPSSNLVSGAVWNGLAFTGSRDNIYCVRYSYLSSVGSTAFQWIRVNAPSGMWSRWACTDCPIGIAYLGRDGIYITTEAGAVNITDEVLYPLFPHDGQPAKSVLSGSNIILPVDMNDVQHLRLSYCDEALRFCYHDIEGNFVTLIYEIFRKRWFMNNYADGINLHYLVELPEQGPNDQEILMLSMNTNKIMMAGGNTDAGVDINSIVLTPSLDGGDQRSQKLYVDAMLQVDGSGIIEMAATFDNAQSFSPVINVLCTGSIQQNLQNIASLADLSLYRNIGAKLSWTGGPTGPSILAWETSGYLQPYLSKFMVTQFFGLSFPGWKHTRRAFPALISNSDVLLTVAVQDGRQYGPFTIPSTNGRFRILPQILPANIKNLAFAFQLDGQGKTFALFLSEFTVEMKEWREETYINLAVFRA